MFLPFIIYGFLLPLLASVVLCRVMRRKLGWLKSRERKAGKEKIHRLYPRPRRPLSGGLAILLAISVGVIVQGLVINKPPQLLSLYFLGVVWAFGLIGLIDDLGKAGGRGISEREKLLLQTLAGLIFGVLLQQGFGLKMAFGIIHLPFVGTFDTSEWSIIFYPLLVTLVLVATSNAVNLTDGIDGLAGGQVSIAAFFFLALCGLLQMPLATEIFLSILAACLGFLVFNYPPARLLMGDMGSLALGAALGAGAIFAGLEAYVPVVGAVFVINTLSVIIQIATVRWLWRIVRFPRQRATEPFRPFLCTPLHHHFQWLGWNEKSILRSFWTMGAVFGVLAVLGLPFGIFWVLGIIGIGLPLLAAAIQKMLRGSYFIGLIPIGEGPARLALFQGQPVEVFGKRFYRLLRQTSLSESSLAIGAAEGLLWRPMTEIEAHVALGSLFSQQHLTDEALSEWEEIPLRNLHLRENVVMQLARLYYSRDRLLEAIQLWEALPRTRLISMPSLQEIVRSARMRLADLASKSYRQCLAVFERAQAGQPQNLVELSRQLALSLGFNNDLLTLLISSRGETDSPYPGIHQLLRAVEPTYQRVETVLRERILTLEKALAWCSQTTENRNGNPLPTFPQAAQLPEQIKEYLGFDIADIQHALAENSRTNMEIVFFQPSPKSSRNAIARLSVRRIGTQEEPEPLLAKSYRAGRIAFFSACYRRERALLRMLSEFGCPVPKPRGGVLQDDRALLLMEDVGAETLAEHLERLDAAGRENLVAGAVGTLADLHRLTSLHLHDLRQEVRKVIKELLTPEYYLKAFRIALERLIPPEALKSGADEINEMLRQYQPVARLLAGRPESFIHFEFTPHHLLVSDHRLTIFDFEQATVGPAEFDLACLLHSPEAGLSEEAVTALLQAYVEYSGMDILDRRAFDYASLSKSLTYAGAATNFYAKFGGSYHLQRLEWYLGNCLHLLNGHAPLGPLRHILAPRLEHARRHCLALLATTPIGAAPEPATLGHSYAETLEIDLTPAPETTGDDTP
jgi:phospho-N-acetylmuramoyl-pentapeptide-transferase